MAWAKIAGGAYLQRTPIVLPPDHWAQVTVWVPSGNLTACNDGDLLGDSAYLLLAADGIFLNDWHYPNADWALETDHGVNAGPMSTNASHTLKYHRKTDNTADWYLDGTLIATDTSVSLFSQLFLGYASEGCACETYYFTDVRVGTTDGGTDIFSDDFSGGLGNWTVKGFGSSAAAATVSSPSDGCPLITLSPAQGPVGTTVHVAGSGFAPSSPLTLYFQNIPVAFSAATSDGSGNVSGTFTVPHAPAGNPDIQDIYDVSLRDAQANVAIAQFIVCSTTPADGIFTGGDPIFADAPTNTPAIDAEVLGYIHHNGAHWVVWQPPPAAGTSFPPPTNHTLNMTRIGDDGSYTNYELDTDYAWGFSSGGVASLGSTLWSKKIWFSSWSKPVYDVKLASDGTTLWVAVLTAETIPYPYISTDDTYGGNPSQISQFVDLVTLTSNFTSFATSQTTGYTRRYHDTTGFAGTFGEYHYPTSDGGDHGFGYWSPPRVVMFAGGDGGFSRIGEIDAKYCPGSTDGTGNSAINHAFTSLYNVAQNAPLGSWNSPLAVCASAAEPGVCHLIWSEGGDWGRYGEGVDAVPDQWDAGPANRSYRVAYSTWDASSKTSEADLWDAHIDRANWYFDYAFQDGSGNWNLWKVGYSWPEQEQMMATGQYQLRNDHGSPVLFIAWPQIVKNEQLGGGIGGPGPDNADRPWLDNCQVYTLPTVQMYDISGGTPVLLQETTADLLPTEAEMEFFYPLDPSRGITAPETPDVIAGGYFGYSGASGTTFTGSAARSFGVSLLYQDPLLGDQPVYLLSVPYFRSVNVSNGGFDQYPVRCFYRVPADGSITFDFLDGTRQVDFTIVGEQNAAFVKMTWGNFDFYSDPKNIWCPNGVSFDTGQASTATTGIMFDRVCSNAWTGYQLEPAVAGSYMPPGWSNWGNPGFYHDPVADTISYPAYVAPTWDGAEFVGPLYAIAQLQVCRGCRSCQCQPSGLHAFLRFGHNH